MNEQQNNGNFYAIIWYGLLLTGWQSCFMDAINGRLLFVTDKMIDSYGE